MKSVKFVDRRFQFAQPQIEIWKQAQLIAQKQESEAANETLREAMKEMESIK